MLRLPYTGCEIFAYEEKWTFSTVSLGTRDQGLGTRPGRYAQMNQIKAEAEMTAARVNGRPIFMNSPKETS